MLLSQGILRLASVSASRIDDNGASESLLLTIIHSWFINSSFSRGLIHVVMLYRLVRRMLGASVIGRVVARRGFAVLIAVLSLNGAGAAPIEIDYSKSSVEVAVNATVDSFVGRLQKYTASIDCETNSDFPSRAEIRFDFKDLATGDKGRDAAMLQWLEYSDHREAGFALLSWRISNSTNYVIGVFKMHGVERELEIPVARRRDGLSWEIAGQAKLDYRDFKLPKIRKALLLTVDPKLVVTFHLMGRFNPGN
jgi:polyisoprenoid-binding protein YceI